MAYVQPRGTPHDVTAAALRQGTRLVTVVAYAVAVAVAVAFALLSPVLPSRGSKAPKVVPAGQAPVSYTVAHGQTYAGIAATHGISLARLFALNPGLTPLTEAEGKQIVIGLR